MLWTEEYPVSIKPLRNRPGGYMAYILYPNGKRAVSWEAEWTGRRWILPAEIPAGSVMRGWRGKLKPDT
jgi:hypothetical protein